ncbi:MAG: site-specific integrase [Actinomycetota bacterium]|nr:site-specific integrase [Actinomycetota bacterium]
MSAASATADLNEESCRAAWVGIDLGAFDRAARLRAEERRALEALGPQGLRRNRSRGVPRRAASSWRALERLVTPLDAARAALHHGGDVRHRRAGLHAVGLVLEHCLVLGRSYWAWTADEWGRLMGSSAEKFLADRALPTETTVRPFVIALAYLVAGFDRFEQLGTFNRLHLAKLAFGADVVESSIGQATETLDAWGYRGTLLQKHQLRGTFSQAFLVNRSPLLEDLGTEAFTRLRAHPATSGYQLPLLYALQRAVAALGHCEGPVRAGYNAAPVIEGADHTWVEWVERWHATSTLTPKVRAIIRTIMAKAGRWLAAEHPEITEPGQWTRATCAAWVAAIDRMSVGDYVQRRDALAGREGTPISPRTKAHFLMASRTFFRDCQEWEWVPRRFDPARALAVPRSIAVLITTDPRVIADDLWAKLLWAGLNLEAGDLPGSSAGTYYPMELIRAVTLTWLFSGLRSDEITRLRVGCVRWRHDGHPIPADASDVLAEEAVCLLDVPVHKTGTAFTKPVDPLLGQAIEAWQRVRPSQSKTLDRKTAEQVDILFAVRAQPIARNYVNRTIIPALCAKAGVPPADVRGRITSHRARSTIASQLYNAKEPMTLFELQAWLGHRSPASTQHYAKISPATLSKAYAEAGYFARNLRTIEVLIDRDAVSSGKTGAGVPWQHYDLGHGYCSYSFFEQCPHRMACARCDFYVPKLSSRAQLLEGKEHLQRMLVTVPLTDDERAAVEDGHAALATLVDRLSAVPSPAGTSPRSLGTAITATELPNVRLRPARRARRT